MGQRDVIEILRRIRGAYGLRDGYEHDTQRLNAFTRAFEHEEPRLLFVAVDQLCEDSARPPTVAQIRARLAERCRPEGAGGASSATGAEGCAGCIDGLRELVSVHSGSAYVYAVACGCAAGQVWQGRGRLGFGAALERLHPQAFAYLTGSSWRWCADDTAPDSPHHSRLRPEERRGEPPTSGTARHARRRAS